MPWLPPFAQLGRYAPHTARKVLTRLTCLPFLSVCLPEHSWGAMPHAQLGQVSDAYICACHAHAVRVFEKGASAGVEDARPARRTGGGRCLNGNARPHEKMEGASVRPPFPHVCVHVYCITHEWRELSRPPSALGWRIA